MNPFEGLKHFTREEFECRCGCGRADMDRAFLQQLDAVRETLGFPITVNSGFRCPAHNASVGGSPRHPTGKAADLGLSHQRARDALTLLSATFQGIGIHQRGADRFIHVDSLDRGIWTY